MKQILSLTLALALLAALFTGCACTANVSTEPNGMITEETTRPTVMPTPTATHEPTRPMETTLPTVTGSEPTGASSTPTDDAAIATDAAGESSTPTDSSMESRHGNRNSAR